MWGRQRPKPQTPREVEAIEEYIKNAEGLAHVFSVATGPSFSSQ
jgi:hypothetical protein